MATMVLQKGHRRLEVFPDEDIMITSYPRSGNTWVRFLLANLIANSGQAIDFPAMEKIIPDVNKSSKWVNLSERPATGRLIKSHIPYDPAFKRVIYIVRDGRDVKVSYYHYHCPHNFQDTFLEFLQRDVWPGPWHEHVASWLDHANDISLLLVRYEDMLTQPEEQLRRMAEFARLPTDKERIAQAVTHSSFTSLQSIEQERGEDRRGPDFKFFRRGICGQWRQYFGPEHKVVFRPHADPVLRRLGYIDGTDW